MPTKIEWTHNDDGSLGETWNPVTGCSHVSEGCRFCYAERITMRFRKDQKPWTAPNARHNVILHPDRLGIPLRWKRPRRIFVYSMADLFHERVPREFIAGVLAIAGTVPQHTYMILTKRPARMLAIMRDIVAMGSAQPPKNLWMGVSVEDQKTADERIPLLLQTPAAVRFVSYEPALGPVDFTIPLGLAKYSAGPLHAVIIPRLDWIIAGGESGPDARSSHPDFFRSVRDQCQAAGAKFFMKQITERGRKIPFESWPADLKVREFPESQ